MASSGVGTSGHISAELFGMMAGIKMVHVPYRGAGPALVDVIGGQCQVIFDLLPSSIGYIRAGSLRALAVTTAARSEALPDVATLADFVPGYEASAWIGIGAPRDAPAAIVDRLNNEINAGLADAGMKARFAELGGTVAPGTPVEFGQFVARETEKWSRVIKFAGIKAD
jgi:tripartite-type tricarboxylate transporter receptor subunit TctC